MKRARVPDPSGSFGREWEGYRWRCVTPSAGPRQIRDARQAFYTGAATAVQLITDLAAAGDVDAVRLIRGEIAEHAENREDAKDVIVIDAGGGRLR